MYTLVYTLIHPYTRIYSYTCINLYIPVHTCTHLYTCTYPYTAYSCIHPHTCILVYPYTPVTGRVRVGGETKRQRRGGGGYGGGVLLVQTYVFKVHTQHIYQYILNTEIYFYKQSMYSRYICMYMYIHNTSTSTF